MVVSFKDGAKLLAVAVVFCAVSFVCNFFLNYYLDVSALRESVPENLIALYEAQLNMAKFTSLISGGCLVIIALVMVAFYVNLYINSNAKNLGVLKAMGYTRGEISLRFWAFGFSVLFGCAVGYALGWACMSSVYDSMTIEGMPPFDIGFHPVLLICLVFLPAIIFAAYSMLCAYISLRCPVSALLKGKAQKEAKKVKSGNGNFLWQVCLGTLSSKKALAFFLALSGFCFSAMMQMSISMQDLAGNNMWIYILVIGLVLAITTLIMSVTSLLASTAKTVALLRADGYSVWESSFAVLGGFRPFIYLGFAVGTAYQFGLLKLMIGVFFSDAGYDIEYNFSVSSFFITLAAFVVFYEASMLICTYIISKQNLKEIMLEN